MLEKLNAPTIIYHVLVTTLLYSIGAKIGLPVQMMLSIALIFMLIRNALGGKHYKNPLLCLIWSTSVFTALFLSANIDFVLAIVLTVFFAITQTSKVDVKETFMWKGGDYEYLEEFIKENEHSPMLNAFEEKLERINKKAYKVYVYRFKEKRTFNSLSDMLDIDSRRVSELIKAVELAMNLYFNIK